ncbi:MAG: hypothetical protein ACYC3I_11245 [Gemmataceae bacterium]
MLLLSHRAQESNVISVSISQFTQMVDRRLAIAQLGLTEARQHLTAGHAEEAGIVLDKIDEDLHLLRRRIIREAEMVAPRSSSLHGCAN